MNHPSVEGFLPHSTCPNVLKNPVHGEVWNKNSLHTINVNHVICEQLFESVWYVQSIVANSELISENHTMGTIPGGYQGSYAAPPAPDGSFAPQQVPVEDFSGYALPTSGHVQAGLQQHFAPPPPGHISTTSARQTTGCAGTSAAGTSAAGTSAAGTSHRVSGRQLHQGSTPGSDSELTDSGSSSDSGDGEEVPRLSNIII
jgi:hypothetical protein